MKLSNKPSASLARKNVSYLIYSKNMSYFGLGDPHLPHVAMECCPHAPLTTYPNYLAHGSFKFIFKYIPEAIDGR